MSIISMNMSMGYLDINIDIKRKIASTKRINNESIKHEKKTKDDMEKTKAFAQNLYQSNIF